MTTTSEIKASQSLAKDLAAKLKGVLETLGVPPDIRDDSIVNMGESWNITTSNGDECCISSYVVTALVESWRLLSKLSTNKDKINLGYGMDYSRSDVLNMVAAQLNEALQHLNGQQHWGGHQTIMKVRNEVAFHWGARKIGQLPFVSLVTAPLAAGISLMRISPETQARAAGTVRFGPGNLVSSAFDLSRGRILKAKAGLGL